MYIIIGLGNPGKKYAQTRHNIGFMVLDKLAERQQLAFKANRKLKGEIAQAVIGKQHVVLVKPLTFMNRSGEAVRAVVDYYQLPQPSLSDRLYLVHDELDLPLGRVRIQRDRAAAGHHGVESVINALGTQAFVRFRVGVRSPYCAITTPEQARAYLLAKFSQAEEEQLAPVLEKTTQAIVVALEEGIDQAMNRFN